MDLQFVSIFCSLFRLIALLIITNWSVLTAHSLETLWLPLFWDNAINFSTKTPTGATGKKLFTCTDLLFMWMYKWGVKGATFLTSMGTTLHSISFTSFYILKNTRHSYKYKEKTPKTWSYKKDKFNLRNIWLCSKHNTQQDRVVNENFEWFQEIHRSSTVSLSKRINSCWHM